MRYEQVIGLNHIKKHLQTTVQNGRIAHAQLFVGETGSGILPLAIAYARSILCMENDTSCQVQMDALQHADLHFSYPIATTASVKEKPKADDFAKEWREIVIAEPYFNLAAWSEKIEVEKKETLINVHEAAAIAKKLSLKSFHGGYKVMIIWEAGKLNNDAANKLLKLIEEPPSKTILLLLTDDEDSMITTIKSRCQLLHIPKVSISEVAKKLQIAENLTESQSQLIARQAHGDYFKALQIKQNAHEDSQFELWFISWVRAAFKAKNKKGTITELIIWAENIATLNREAQKRFLLYSIEFFRQALLYNYKAHEAVYFNPNTENFSLEKFAPFIDGHKIVDIITALDEGIYHIERNGNSKIIITDIAIMLTRFIHKSS